MEPLWKIEDVDQSSSDLVGFFKISAVGDDDPTKEKVIEAIRINVESIRIFLYSDDPERATRSKTVNQSFLNKLAQTAGDFVANYSSDGENAELESRLLERISLDAGYRTAQLDALLTPEYAHLISPDKSPELRINLPETATADQQSLAVDLMRTASIVKIVFGRRLRRSQIGIWFAKTTDKDEKSFVEKKTQLASVLFLYFRELKEIADVGLSAENHVIYAQKRLDIFKANFVDQEADNVKNQHVKQLGLWAFAISAAFFIASLVAPLLGGSQHLVNFAYIGAAASAGTWLSFSLRKAELGFLDLATLEEDRLNPVGRIIFVVLLTFVLALMLKAHIVDISIGTTKVTPDDRIMAIVLGVLAGIAERSLSAAISTRAGDIIGSAGKVNTTSGAGAR
ncbi:hypothetical protein [Rhizobium leguminosarum]|uniref:hypothetical protein n=1 Tax=Rhizobium leguminosarum TaxID=384 RepID=UPI003F9B424E